MSSTTNCGGASEGGESSFVFGQNLEDRVAKLEQDEEEKDKLDLATGNGTGMYTLNLIY